MACLIPAWIGDPDFKKPTRFLVGALLLLGIASASPCAWALSSVKATDASTPAASGKLPQKVTVPFSHTDVAPAKLNQLNINQDALIREDARIVINIPSRTLWLYEGKEIIRYFPVGVGRLGFMTPVGKYKIIHKVENPGWENPYLAKGKVRVVPGDENPLGTRWMGFLQDKNGEFGMHGTDRPQSVGKFSSHGCVRMKVADAEVLFNRVDLGTPVEVVYEPVLIRKGQDNHINVIVYKDVFKKGMPTAEQVTADILKQYPGSEIDPAQLQSALLAPTERPQAVATWTPPIAKAPQAPVVAKPKPTVPGRYQNLPPFPSKAGIDLAPTRRESDVLKTKPIHSETSRPEPSTQSSTEKHRFFFQ
jgi:lipoprotein-anchoring transpeptidase ErfK/SrfK